MDLSLRANLKSFILLIVIGCLIWWIVHRIFNPREMNQLTIVSEVPLDAIPMLVEFSGEVEWSQKFQSHITVRGNFLYFTYISNAWFRGQISVEDEQGNLILTQQVTPPGRYCGNFSILLDENGRSHTAWNQLPSIGDTTPVED
ncbi:MAG: hypothetical protein P8M30_19050 [Planctomycetaceae bacterium]|nr:hypothetical protein [Planctomycetaceae bacterium]